VSVHTLEYIITKMVTRFYRLYIHRTDNSRDNKVTK